MKAKENPMYGMMVYFDAKTFDEIDKARKYEPRSSFVRRIVLSALEKSQNDV